MKTKAAVQYEYNQPMVIEEVELAGPKEKELLIKYEAAGLCHSDLSVMKGVMPLPLPMVLGHEGAGVVQEVGPGVTKFKPGDHVVMAWVPVCGQCYFCLRGQPFLCQFKDKTRGGTMLDGTCRMSKGSKNIGKFIGVGSFSEYNVVNEENVHPLAKGIPFEVAAVSGCAAMTGVGAVINTAQVTWGSSVAVVGIGGVGLYAIQGAVLANATKIIAIDVLDNKLEYAKKFGATHVINATKEDAVAKVKEITGGLGVDYAFEALGKLETSVTAFNMIRIGGKAVIVGIPDFKTQLALPLYEFPLMQKSVLGCYYGSGDVRTDLATLLGLYETGRLKITETITDHYSLDKINDGFNDMVEGKNIRGVVKF